MELSSGEEFYIACDNTGTPLAVFSNNGLLLKQAREPPQPRLDLPAVMFLALMWRVCAHTGAVHGVRGGVLRLQPRVRAGDRISRRLVRSPHTSPALWGEGLRHFRREVGALTLTLMLMLVHALIMSSPPGGPLLTSACGHAWLRTLSPSTCTCFRATTPSAKCITSKNM